MLVLDTNHLKELAYPTPLVERLRGRLLQAGSPVFTTVITLEEELRGVLARANRTLDSDERILAYQKLIERVNFFARWVILPLDAESAAAFTRFRSQGVRIGTMYESPASPSFTMPRSSPGTPWTSLRCLA